MDDLKAPWKIITNSCFRGKMTQISRFFVVVVFHGCLQLKITHFVVKSLKSVSRSKILNLFHDLNIKSYPYAWNRFHSFLQDVVQYVVYKKSNFVSFTIQFPKGCCTSNIWNLISIFKISLPSFKMSWMRIVFCKPLNHLYLNWKYSVIKTLISSFYQQLLQQNNLISISIIIKL